MTARDSGGGAQALSWRRLARLAGVLVVPAASAGLYPTWLLTGTKGLLAAGAALTINIVIYAASAAGIRAVTRRKGALAGGTVAAYGAFARLVLVMLLGYLADTALNAGYMIFWVWAFALYVLMAVAEACWASRGLAAPGAKDRADA